MVHCRPEVPEAGGEPALFLFRCLFSRRRRRRRSRRSRRRRCSLRPPPLRPPPHLRRRSLCPPPPPSARGRNSACFGAFLEEHQQEARRERGRGASVSSCSSPIEQSPKNELGQLPLSNERGKNTHNSLWFFSFFLACSVSLPPFSNAATREAETPIGTRISRAQEQEKAHNTRLFFRFNGRRPGDDVGVDAAATPAAAAAAAKPRPFPGQGRLRGALMGQEKASGCDFSRRRRFGEK